MSALKKFYLDDPDPLELAKTLLKIEPLGVLTRDICYQAIPTDEEDQSILFGEKKTWGVIPPRLFFFPKKFLLVHCYGEDAFYAENPEYERGGLSKECYVLEDIPRFLSNYFAMEETYQRVGFIPNAGDPLSLEQRRPPPLTNAEVRAMAKEMKQHIKDRVAEYQASHRPVLQLVRTGEDNECSA